VRKTKHRPKAPLSPMPSTMVQNVAEVLTNHGYGMSKEMLAQELAKISNLPQFLYTFARCGEKDREALHQAWEMSRGWT